MTSSSETKRVIKREEKSTTKKMKSFGGNFFIFSLFICKNKKEVVQKDEKGNKGRKKSE